MKGISSYSWTILLVILFACSEGTPTSCKMNLEGETRIPEAEFATTVREDSGKLLLEEYMTQRILVYRMSDGRIFANDEGSCWIFKDENQLRKYVADITSKEGSGDILYKVNIYGQEFPSYADSLASEVCKSLNFPAFIPSEAFLQELDERINQTKDAKAFRKKHFLHLIATVGCTSNKKLGTKWLMKVSPDQYTWHPNVQYDGRTIGFVVPLYEDITENHEWQLYPTVESYRLIEGIIQRVNSTRDSTSQP